MLGIPVLYKEVEIAGSLDSLASQPSLPDKLQASERPSQRWSTGGQAGEGGGQWSTALALLLEDLGLGLSFHIKQLKASSDSTSGDLMPIPDLGNCIHTGRHTYAQIRIKWIAPVSATVLLL